jgi:hypothetical protein
MKEGGGNIEEVHHLNNEISVWQAPVLVGNGINIAEYSEHIELIFLCYSEIQIILALSNK